MGVGRARCLPLTTFGACACVSSSSTPVSLLYGISSSLLVLAGLGLDPWDVFHQGLSRTFGLAIGTWAIIVGVAVLLLWIPLRQKPGIGTSATSCSSA